MIQASWLRTLGLAVFGITQRQHYQANICDTLWTGWHHDVIIIAKEIISGITRRINNLIFNAYACYVVSKYKHESFWSTRGHTTFVEVKGKKFNGLRWYDVFAPWNLFRILYNNLCTYWRIKYQGPLILPTCITPAKSCVKALNLKKTHQLLTP
jgi:hypothetical protein